MKTLSVIAYIIGSLILIASCFTASISLTWWLGAIALVFLIAGCILQFNSKRQPAHTYARHGTSSDRNTL